MKIVFSRHTRRRLKLFRIDEKDVVGIIESSVKQERYSAVERAEVIDKSFVSKYMYPIKVVFVQEKERIIVVTAYPLKKGRQS